MTIDSAALASEPQEPQEAQPQPDMDIQKLLDVLVPPASVEITDIFGNNYKVPSACSARAQIKILQELDGLRNNPTVVDVIRKGFYFDEMTELVGIIVRVASDPDVMAGIAKAFALAHPRPFAEASNHAKNEGFDFDDAADLFPVEELAGAVVPLFIRLIRRGTSAVQVLNRATSGIA